MNLFINFLFLVLGLIFLIKGADFFVTGASGAARKMKVPALIIGLTVVAIGTSFPELAVSISSAISGSVDMAVGDVVGSNMFNTFMIVGITACITPIMIKPRSRKIDFPFLILSTCLLLIFASDSVFGLAQTNIVTRWESIVLIAILVLYIFINVYSAKKEIKFSANIETEEKPKQEKVLKGWQIALYIIIGLAGVVFGGECVSRASQFIAIELGMSEALVGLTIVALGTSLPELATCIVAAKKGEIDLAIGNIIGSNIMNIVLILGLVGTITQIPVSSAILVDLFILFVTTVVFVLLALHRMKIGWVKGMILIMIYAGYLTFAIVRNYCF